MRRILLFAGVLAVLVGGVAWAAIPDSGGVIHACVLNATKTIRLIDTSKPANDLTGHCTSLETELTWSQRGPVGPAGQKGDTGPAGPAGGQPAPDPLKGSWAVLVDGAFAGPAKSVEGCGLASDVVLERPGPDGVRHKHLAGVDPESCTVAMGLSIQPPLVAWIQDMLNRGIGRKEVTLVRTDDAGAAALRLPNAQLVGLALPALARASTGPAFLQVEVAPDVVQRVAAPGLPAGADLALHPIAQSTLDLRVNGTSVAAATTGAVSAKAVVTADPRDPQGFTRDVAVSDLGARVPESETALIASLDSFLDHFLVRGFNGQSDEVPITLAVGDGGADHFRLTLDPGGISKGDLAPRADGTRRYSFYSETASVSQP